ncbi:MAG TPA: sugar phosphate isomerase/epimerase [Acidimicrobiales bacterium]|nr:sugar phosphate isomerase/epimerase [Acidimicrobiales bacterium]
MAAVELELCWGTARGAALPELLDVAGAAGYRSVAVRPSMYYDARSDGFGDGELRARMDDAGVVVGVVDPLTAGLPGVPAAASVPPAMRAFVSYGEDDCCAVAEALGAPVVNVAHFLGTPQPAGLLADAIGALAERAAARGLRVALEFIPGTGIPDLPSALALCREVGTGTVGIMFDTWHFYRSGGTVDELGQLPPGVVFGCQVSDASPAALEPGYVPMTDRLLPGRGTLPLPAVLAALVGNNPDLRIGVEVFRNDLRRMGPDRAARTVADAMGPILDAMAGAADG